MLEHERCRTENEIDIDARLIQIHLQSFSASTSVIQGIADATALAVWSHWRAPTGRYLPGRTLRHVVEAACSKLIRGQRGVLGFNHLTQVGAGLEIDTSAMTYLILRARPVGR